MNLDKKFIRGSFILLISFGLFNFLNFVFQFFMLRLMTIEDYAILATLFGITGILTIFSESIQLIITKYSSEESSEGKIKNLLKRSLKKASYISTIFFFSYILIAFPLSKILKIPYFFVIFHGLILFLLFLSPITRGIMQGLKMFGNLGINLSVESVIKLVSAIFLVSIGFGVYGAIGGVLFGGLFALILSFGQISKVLKSKEVNYEIDKIYTYSTPLFFIILIITVFYSIDIIIAKILFDAKTAGYYAVASILAKTIFWGTQPISKTLFPISAGNKGDRKSSKKTYLNGLGILSLITLPAIIIFYFFPDLIVRVFSGKYIYESSQIVFYLAIGCVILSFANLNLIYKLSLGKIKDFWIFGVFIFVEICLLTIFSNNLIEFSVAFITSAVALLWGSIMIGK